MAAMKYVFVPLEWWVVGFAFVCGAIAAPFLLLIWWWNHG